MEDSEATFEDVKKLLEKAASLPLLEKESVYRVDEHAFAPLVFEIHSSNFNQEFKTLARLLEPYSFRSHFNAELVQYRAFIALLSAQIETLKYFFGQIGRKLVVARPDECISLIQISYDDAIAVTSAHLRSSSLELFASDLLFLFSVPHLLDLKSSIWVYQISVNNLHRGVRAALPKEQPKAFSIKDFEKAKKQK